MKSATTTTTKKAPVKKAGSAAFPIVAIGASAGGLEALTELLLHLSPETGMAFIYVQHLSPDHKSMLSSLLSKSTSMKVQEVKNKALISPNNLYVIPPDKEMTVDKRHIILKPRPHTPKFNLPIDILFTSLAEVHHENAIGIILSGSATDGTQGMRVIKHEGGTTFAQDDSARFDSMPRSAIAAGVVDYILPPKEIAKELNHLSKLTVVHPTGLRAVKEDMIDNNDPDLKNILIIVFKATGVDFSAYKLKTIKRRILRRMIMLKINTLADYAQLLNDNEKESDILFNDMLINVTSFFRDTETHKYLKTTLLPKLIKSKDTGEQLRIWVPACSTGEEAFSIAMALIEIQESTASDVPLQIFASDISAEAIRKARIGFFTKEEIGSVAPWRIHRFFTKSDGGYRIARSVRNICLFATHNILVDPPFSHLDFISCRNLLIYLDAPAQKRLMATFHFALSENGYLMLGKSETIGTSGQLFAPINNTHKIYSRKAYSGTRPIPSISPRIPLPKRTLKGITNQDKPMPSQLHKTIPLLTNRNIDSAIDAVLVAEFMPPSAVINHQMDILQFRGSTDLYLTHAPGKATFNIIKMARREIAFGLRNAISEAIKTKQRISKSGIEMKLKDAVHVIGIEVVPLNLEWEEPLLLVLFTQQVQVAPPYSATNPGDSVEKEITDARILQLEEELAAAHADALAYSQDQEAYIVELQSANEEVVSSNEELQTLNEELETSKEEIESTNEELITSNEELQTRNELLNESYEYSHAIISTLHEPLIILDKDLRVRTASNAFYKKFGLTEEETEGVRLYDLGNKQWNIPRLRELLEEIVPRNSNFHDFEMRHTFPGIGEKILILNASRIAQKSHGESLILLSISDVTEAVILQLKEKDRLAKEFDASKRYNMELEKAVEDRTSEIIKKKMLLEEKNTELLKMNKELEAFAFISSHDLQEPLRRIQTFASRILEKEEKKLSDSGKNYFRLMQSSANQMQALIQDLLTFSRLGSSKAKFVSIDLHKIVEEVIGDYKELIEENHATISAKVSCNALVVPFQLRQLLNNLISNAFKFAQPGISLHIIIKSRQVKFSKPNPLNLPLNKPYCHMSISDNGIGFDQAYGKKIFNIFEKLHSKDDYAGTGIGLAIVKKIVDNHHGKITATSKLNKGTTFDIYIPA
jgi:two-component system, chemotaxis family, CheB/CheR fusion protein